MVPVHLVSSFYFSISRILKKNEDGLFGFAGGMLPLPPPPQSIGGCATPMLKVFYLSSAQVLPALVYETADLQEAKVVKVPMADDKTGKYTELNLRNNAPLIV